MKNTIYITKIIVLVIFLFSCNGNNKQNQESQQPYLIMISLDGFRRDYTQNAHTPVFDSLVKVGVMAEALIPAFPTKTFPNHYTMATGLYPDNHGIVLNGFYADDQKCDYNKNDKSTVADGKFYGGEPIWCTAELQGVKSATLFWVGSEAEIKGVRPSIWAKYNHELAFEARIDSVFNWLSRPESQRPHLIMWYYDEPDSKAHEKGPESEELTAEIEKLDSYLGDFFTKMRTLPFFNQLNFIVTSDHGMGSISPDKQIILDEIIDTANLAYFDGWNPIWNLKVKEGKLNKVYNSLKNIEQLQVWYHDSIPDRLHYGTNPRTHDITVVAKPKWSIYWSWNVGRNLGAHGYDNNFKDMQAIFYAAGPAFKNNYKSPAFENIHLYPLIAEILKVNPAQTEGNLTAVDNMLIKKR
ncbi:MAG: alkaline phosphatase family protein [Bacteroidetes bacterium]|nr:alkaline phosphatase family protein [Bacteroidota bacterium]MBL6943704.1 alkaline phosphatase family protein [Bacteroidales bacterium]